MALFSSWPPTNYENRLDNLPKYEKLYRAALLGDWESGRKFFNDEPEAYAAEITRDGDTVLHIASKAKATVVFLREVLNLIPDSSMKPVLEHQNDGGKTALCVAATVGNTEAAELLVTKHRGLLYIMYAGNMLPIGLTAAYANRHTFSYLMKAMNNDVNPSPSPAIAGPMLVANLIIAGCMDLAWDVICHNPHMAASMDSPTPLVSLAVTPDSFPSAKSFNFLQSLIYSCVPEDCPNIPAQGDVENQLAFPHELQMHSCFQPIKNRLLAYAWRKLGTLLWEVIKLLPFKCIQQVGETKRTHQSALKLLRFTCQKARQLHVNDAGRMLYPAFASAAAYDIPEIIEEILVFYPMMVQYTSVENNQHIFQTAVARRHEKVFNLLYQTNGITQYLSHIKDRDGNNILHSAGLLPTSDVLNQISGPALQMQREIQWFKEVENFVMPYYRRTTNHAGKTPKELFTEEHRELVKEGEKWMKDCANSCTVAASLIATVVFAAAITIPGGNKDDGNPNFSKEKTFNIFAVFDAMSLFSSTAAILMFLSIYTARYAEADFLYTLPKRLILGLICLFLSITSMMLAFVAAIYLVFGNKRAWILIPIGVSAALPVTLFATLQFPLLLDMIYSTYGPGIFGMKSNRIIY